MRLGAVSLVVFVHISLLFLTNSKKAKEQQQFYTIFTKKKKEMNRKIREFRGQQNMDYELLFLYLYVVHKIFINNILIA